MYKKILLPTDGSDLSLRAVQAGIELAACLKASVVAFHGMTPLPAFAVMGNVVELNADALIAQTTELAHAYLANIGKRASQAGVPCETEYVSTKRAYKAIVEAATRHGCDLIVMGSHGWQGFDRLLLGSETHKVILNSSVPVLVVR